MSSIGRFARSQSCLTLYCVWIANSQIKASFEIAISDSFRNDGAPLAPVREFRECRTHSEDQMRFLFLSCRTCARTPARPWRA